MDFWKISAFTPWHRSPFMAIPVATTTTKQGAPRFFANALIGPSRKWNYHLIA
jgi:hypothetical protein